MTNGQTNSSPAEPSFQVVVNGEDQYSIWPADRPMPAGWSPAGHSGPKAACLAYVDEVWKDMRPASLREAMATPR